MGRGHGRPDVWEMCRELIPDRSVFAFPGEHRSALFPAGKVALGPITDAAQLGRVDALVRDTVAAGARLAAGGSFEGLFYRPTVLAEVTPSMPAYAGEVFGPVAPVVPFATEEEAVALAADSEYGLSLGILGDVGQAMRIADAVPTGLVHINDQTVNDEPVVPFGGWRRRGTARGSAARTPTSRRSPRRSG